MLPTGQLRVPKTMYIVVFVLCVGIIVTLLNVFELRAMQSEHFKSHSLPTVEGELDAGVKRKPIAWIRANNAEGGYLDHVFAVLKRIGFAVSYSKDSSWDLLWNHNYPFLDEELRPILLNLQPHQKVNHVPGSGYYTSKVNLATSNISGIPPAFSLPAQKDQFVSFAGKHPEIYWVQKSNKHRGIKIKQMQELDLNAENSFIQEYISKPLLIDKRKFDIGVYTVVTSLKPLRVYVYEGDVLLRFCPQDYHPFDPTNVDKYVVGDDYTPTWEMPSLSPYFTTQDQTFKESLNAYLRAHGKNPELIWERIRETIRQVFCDKATLMQPLGDKYKYPWNFFELSRFDFVLDEDLNVYLMEANMSPNLSSAHFAPNKLLYEQVIFNLLSLVGVARRVHSDSLKIKQTDEQQMLASDKDVQVFSDQCGTCANCEQWPCQLCSPCISASLKHHLRVSYAEHMSRTNMRRVIPRPISDPHDDYESRRRIDATCTSAPEDFAMDWWFKGKCIQDRSWCS